MNHISAFIIQNIGLLLILANLTFVLSFLFLIIMIAHCYDKLRLGIAHIELYLSMRLPPQSSVKEIVHMKSKNPKRSKAAKESWAKRKKKDT